MNHEYEYDICIVGPGRIGLPWAAALSKNGFNVICIDVDEDQVKAINKAEAPFHEPKMEDYMKEGVSQNRLKATTDQEAVEKAKVIGFTLNAPEDEQERYLNILGDYANHFEKDQVIVNRTTLPIHMTEESEKAIAEHSDIPVSDLNYVTFPERLAEGKAIEEIESLPKIAGTESQESKKMLKWITSPFEGKLSFTDKKTAMFVKVIDNTYRDARFAIANQLAIIAEELGLDAHEAIRIANDDYPRNDIPLPGTVGGKCLTKDPHFIMDKRLFEQHKSPDLFYHTRKVNTKVEDRIFDRVISKQPDIVTILGTGFKKDNGDEFKSPSIRLKDRLKKVGIEIREYDPHVGGKDSELESKINKSDLVLVAVNHSEFEEREQEILNLANDKPIIDVWGILEKRENVERFGGPKKIS